MDQLPMSTQHMRVSNKATALRELQRSHKMHTDKLRNMKAQIDMKMPKQYPHVQCNAKRLQMEADRNSTIERENKILLGNTRQYLLGPSALCHGDNGWLIQGGA